MREEKRDKEGKDECKRTRKGINFISVLTVALPFFLSACYIIVQGERTIAKLLVLIAIRNRQRERMSKTKRKNIFQFI